MMIGPKRHRGQELPAQSTRNSFEPIQPLLSTHDKAATTKASLGTMKDQPALLIAHAPPQGTAFAIMSRGVVRVAPT